MSKKKTVKKAAPVAAKAPSPVAPSVTVGKAEAPRRRGRESKYVAVAKAVLALTGEDVVYYDLPKGKSAISLRGSLQTAIGNAVRRIAPEQKISVYACSDDRRVMITKRGAKVPTR